MKVACTFSQSVEEKPSTDPTPESLAVRAPRRNQRVTEQHVRNPKQHYQLTRVLKQDPYRRDCNSFDDFKCPVDTNSNRSENCLHLKKL
uniref:Uncharacterized protein n=1 Tax=Ditylenchus dipsaci TaxID=166011 RepID=A0A915E321_9BILA